jgi:hypothetical protein
MHKLTEKQAKWLIEQFNIAHTSLMKEPAEGMFHVMDCRAIINRCTEIEFPAFEVQLEHPWHLKVKKSGDSIWVDTLKDGVPNQTSLTLKINSCNSPKAATK